jgi:arsenate reductase-like glutaredoxin family protein
MNINEFLGREQTSQQIRQILNNFDDNCKKVDFKKGIYIYGSPGCGKTRFVIDLLKEMNYDIIKYDAGDVRNKTLIDSITNNNISNRNVLHMMTKTVKKIAIVMDEIDGMNNGDKGGITALIKLIRQKKTKKQRLEDITLNPIICIGNHFFDKKMRELMKVCNTFELKMPTTMQISKILDKTIPNISIKPDILQYIQGDLRKLEFIQKIHNNNPNSLNQNLMKNILLLKSYNEDSKNITKLLINEHIPIEKHNIVMNETDRTIIALIWHENIVDVMAKHPRNESYPFYLKILDNMCFADYIDRITFQNQIWQFNEMSSLIKTFHNNKIYHETFKNKTKIESNQDIRFTKVLTKYSTEYNNQLFIYNMAQQLDMDKKDLIAFFQELRLFYGNDFYNQIDKINTIEYLFEDYSINKLDIKRMYRYLDKNVKKDTDVIVYDDIFE